MKLTQDEWNTIKPKLGQTKLASGWTELLVSKLYEKSFYCVINFKYHHVRKENGRKKKGSYFVAKSKCKFNDCSEYIFEIKKTPPQTQTKGITIRVKRIGDIKHTKTTTHKRITRKPERIKIAENLKAESISAWYYKAYAKLEDDAKMGGNISKPRTQLVLRKIKSEELLEANVHVDVLQEVKILNDVYRDIETDGYIRFLAIQPFQCHMYLREQLQSYIQANKGHNAVLYFDATGSIVQKIPGQNHRIFLYSMVMQNPIEGRSALPIAEFLSNDHHSSEIRHFLGVFCNNVKQLSSNYVPRQVETDLSWAMIQGVLQAFNEHNAKAYLDYIWDVIHKDHTIKEMKTKTFVHTCSAHMLQVFIRTLSLKKVEKGLSNFILRTLSCLLNCTDIEESRKIFCNMCDVMLPKYESEQSKKGLKSLTALIKQTKGEEVDLENLEEFDAKEFEEDGNDATVVLKKSKFYRSIYTSI